MNELEEMQQRKDEAYAERNRVVALLARLFPSGIRKTNIQDWDPEWHNCVYIDLPLGQVSWHYHDRHIYLFASLPPYTKPYDGHDTLEKYCRVQAQWILMEHTNGQQQRPNSDSREPKDQGEAAKGA